MIFCVDDDDTIREIELYALESMGFKARGFADGEAMLEALKTETPRLILLDVMMPGIDGVTLLNRLRAEPAYRDVPVIMATARGTEMDKISALNAGADDYLVKPFGVLEMVARIKAVLRRTDKPAPQDALTVGALVLRLREHEVTAAGVRVTLTNKEFELLRLFMQNPNAVFTRDRLMNEVWGTDYVGETRTVDAHIKTLRRKLGDAGGAIKTVIGVGYRLECES